MAIKRCKAAFVKYVGGRPRMLNPGMLLDAEDQIVVDHPEHFEDVETYVSDRTAASVEQATAEPGGKRTRRVPTRTKTESDKEDGV